MNGRRLALTAAAVFVVKAAVGAVSFGLVLDGLYDGSSPAFRPEGRENHGIGLVGELSWALAFAYLFLRGPERRGWLDGVRFGLLVWCFYFVPMTMGVLGYFSVDAPWAIGALAVGIVEAMLCGVSAGLVGRRSRAAGGPAACAWAPAEEGGGQGTAL